jgi:hypothetical protein
MTKRPRDQGQRVMQQMRMLRNVVMTGGIPRKGRQAKQNPADGVATGALRVKQGQREGPGWTMTI